MYPAGRPITPPPPYAPPPSLAFVTAAIDQMSEVAALAGEGPVSMQALEAAMGATGALLTSLPLDPSAGGDESGGSTTSTTGSAAASERMAVAAALRGALGNIAGAAERSAPIGGPPIVITSPVLNISAQRLPAPAPGDNASLAQPILASVASGDTQAAVQLPAGLLSSVVGNSSSEPVGMVMWSSNLDLHGTGSTSAREMAGATVSVSLKQGGQPLNVTGTAPILLTMPIGAAVAARLNSSAGAARPCIGQPTAEGLFARANEGDAPCTGVIECNYWDEERLTWSTDGCETVPTADGGMACSCTHLTDFTSVQVPTSFEGDIEFFQLNVASNVTLQCACNMGVQATLSKTEAGPTPRSVRVDVIDGGDVAWRLLEVIHHRANVSWVDLQSRNGTRRDPILLDMNASGLAEMGGDLAYEASLIFEVLDSSLVTRTVTIPVEAQVSASVVANASAWGNVLAGSTCDQSQLSPINMLLGEQRDVFFTACDVDRLPVAHELPTERDRRTFAAVLSRQEGAGPAAEWITVPVVGLGGSSYKATVTVTQNIGLHLLTVDLAGERLAFSMPLLVTCPSPLIPFDNNRSCSCPAGYEESAAGSLECAMCPTGKFQSHARGMPCQECPIGSFQKAMGRTSCDLCAPDTYQQETGQTRCDGCPFGLSTNRLSGQAGCKSCTDGSFNRFPSLNAAEDTCRICVSLSTCTDNTTLTNLNVEPGGWRLSDRSAAVVPCFRDAYAVGNSTAYNSSCLGGRNSSSYCAEGTHGPLCSLCSEQDRHVYFNQRRSRCEDCPDPTLEIFSVIAAIAALLLLLYFVRTRFRTTFALLMRAQARVRLILNIIGLQSKFKRFIGLYQFMDQITPVFEIAMPSMLVDLLGFPVLRWFQLDISFVYPGACVGSFATKLLLQTMGPLVTILLVLFFSAIRGAWKAREEVNVTTLFGAKSGLAEVAPMALFISFLFVIPASIPIFDSFTCVDFIKDSDLYDAGRRDFEAVGYFLASDYSVACSGPNTVTWWPTGHPPSAEHERIQAIAFVMLFVWPIGIPLVYYILLWSSRDALKARRPTRVSRCAYFLHGEYKPEFYFWECLDLFRRLTLVGFLRAMTNNAVPISRLVCGAVVAQGFLFMILWLRPHRKDVDNFVAAMVHLTVLGMLLTGCLLEMHQRARLLDTYVSQQYVSRVMLGFEEVDDWLALVLFCIPLTTIAVMVGVVVVKLVLTKFPKNMHDKETGDMVQLSLEKHHKYHTFLSHIWGTGQDQVAAIKRQLCLLVPGISIFLDVDDLEEISALERYIDETAVILIFLSKGYFRSKNCLREVVATVKKRKPVVLVWEPDPNKGGAPVEALKEELRGMKEKFVEWSFDATVEECEDYIFRESQLDGRPTVPWFRIYDFQLKSLSMIAQVVLTSTPAYNRSTRPLMTYVPGEVNVKTLPLKAPICFYVSPLNPGADAVAQEMTSISGLCVTTKPPKGGDALELELPEPDDSDPEAAQFILYLNSETFTGDVGKRFGEQVRGLLAAKVPYFMIHENDPSRNGCEFGLFFSTTPQDLINNGIYGPLAITYSWGPHREVSLGISAKVMIGEAAKGTFKEMDPAARRATLRKSTTASNLKRGTTGKLPTMKVEANGVSAVATDPAGVAAQVEEKADPKFTAAAYSRAKSAVPISREYVLPEGAVVGIEFTHESRGIVASRIQPGSMAHALEVPEGGELIEVNGESLVGKGLTASQALITNAAAPLRLRFRHPPPPDIDV